MLPYLVPLQLDYKEYLIISELMATGTLHQIDYFSRKHQPPMGASWVLPSVTSSEGHSVAEMNLEFFPKMKGIFLRVRQQNIYKAHNLI